MSEKREASWPSCPLWREAATSDDEDAIQRQELASVLCGRTGAAVVLSGGMGPLIAEQPFSQGIPYAEWNLSDSALIGQLHGLFHAAGADCAVTHTLGCSDVQLDAGLARVARESNVGAVREARSCGPRFVLGALGQVAEERPDGLEDSLCRQATQLADAGVHGLLLLAHDVALAADLVRAILKVVRLPLVAMVPFSSADAADDATDRQPEGPLTPDGLTPSQAFSQLAAAGAFAVGASVRLEDAASFSTALASAADAAGRGLVVRLDGDERDAQPGERDGSLGSVAVRTAAESLVRAGVRVLGYAGPDPLGATAAILATLDQLSGALHFEVL
ncbi:MAG: homocysteine S-methyltransferase family protein [Parafannyhessea sp.]|uniref:homocysteine S-methyltransferase family protein n=1 Tax=Parafannyhessea sp. TaxID=2847324 RepID=UPI003EFEBCB4